MMYTVAPFYTDIAEGEHPWGGPFPIGVGDLPDYRVAARETVERLLSNGEPDGRHPLGLRVVDTGGDVVFTYIRPAPSGT